MTVVVAAVVVAAVVVTAVVVTAVEVAAFVVVAVVVAVVGPSSPDPLNKHKQLFPLYKYKNESSIGAVYCKQVY